MRTTEKQAGAISLALVLGGILLVWTALLAARPEPAEAQAQKAKSEEIRMKGKGGNELVVTADQVTVTSDDVVVTKDARNTGQVQGSSGVVGDEEGGSEPKVGSDETGTSPEDSPIEEAAPGSPADRESAPTEGERGTAGGGTTTDGSSTEEYLSEEGLKPEDLLRMALEECAMVVSGDEEIPDNNPSEKGAPEATTETSTVDEEQPSEGSAEETVSEEQRNPGKVATPRQTPDKKAAPKKKDGKEARHATKAPETIPAANEDPTGTEEVVPEETTARETTGEATAREAQAGDSATDTTPAKETTATEKTAEEETTATEEGASEEEDDVTGLLDGPALGLTRDDCEKMFAVIAEYNELYDTPTEYDNNETARQQANPESEPAEGESKEDDNGVESEHAGGSTGEGTTPGGASREERLVRPGASGTEEAASTEEPAKEETGEEAASPGQGARKSPGFAFRPEEEPGEDGVVAAPEGESVSRDEEGRAPAPAEPPAGSRTVNRDDGAMDETASERTAAEKTTTGAAEKAPDSSSWGERSSNAKNIALPEQNTPDGTRVVLPKTGGSSPGALAPVAALTAGLPLGAILGVLSLGAGTLLVGFALYRRGSSSAGNSRDEEDEGYPLRRDG